MALDELHGRDLETAAIECALDAVQGGRPVLVCFAGEPGVGKTSLLAGLGESARSRGMLALGAGGAEFERSVPFGVFTDALDDHLAGLGRRSLDRLDAGDLRRWRCGPRAFRPRDPGGDARVAVGERDAVRPREAEGSSARPAS